MENEKQIPERNRFITSEIILQFNEVEKKIKEIIHSYINSNKKEFVKDILLNNSIINFNGKKTLLISIIKSNKNILSEEEIFDLKKGLLIIMKIRNIVAHSDNLYYQNYKASIYKEGDLEFLNFEEAQSETKTINDGRVEVSEIEKNYNDFEKHVSILKPILEKLEKGLNS